MNSARFDTELFQPAMRLLSGQRELVHSESLAKVQTWMREGRGSLLLMGGVGTGKTTIAAAACRCWVELATIPLMSTCDLLADRLKQDESYKYEVAYHKGLLALDDLGTEGKVYGEESLPFIIYRRYERNLPTIITTNYDSKRLAERYGERIADRLRTWDKIVLNFKSLRQ